MPAAFFDRQQRHKSDLDLDYVPSFLSVNMCSHIREAEEKSDKDIEGGTGPCSVSQHTPAHLVHCVNQHVAISTRRRWVKGRVKTVLDS